MPVEFDDPWPDTFTKGGKRWRFAQAARRPDAFVGFGKTRAQKAEGTWANLLGFAYAVLSSDNTKRIVQRCEDVPDSTYIPPGRVPATFDYFQSPFRHGSRPYTFEPDGPGSLSVLDGEWVETELKVTSNLRAVLQADTDDQWIFHHDAAGLDDGKRAAATWWELVCFSLLVLSSPNTERILFEVDTVGDGDVPLLDRGTVVERCNPVNRPYAFADGVEAQCSSRGTYDF